jgi:hypothetical protein
MFAPSLTLLLAGALTAPMPGVAARFEFKGMFVEGCSCAKPCVYEFTGANPGCKAAGVFSFDSGTYAGKSLAGTRAAFALGAEGWYRLYVDGPDAKRRETVTQFMRAALKDFGKPEAVRHLPITVKGFSGTYTVQISGGSVLSLKTSRGEEPPTTYSKLYNKTLHPTIVGTRTLECTFKDGKRSMEFSGSNGFYNSKLRVSGKL